MAKERVTNFIGEIIHGIQVSESVHLNDKSRHLIDKKAHTLSNESELKWNELRIWINNHPEASVKQIGKIQALLDEGKTVRGLNIEGEKI